METKLRNFQNILDQNHQFPCSYTFKFIIPVHSEKQADIVLFDHEVQKRMSKKGNYLSLTLELEVESSDRVIQIYQQAHQINGLIAL